MQKHLTHYKSRKTAEKYRALSRASQFTTFVRVSSAARRKQHFSHPISYLHYTLRRKHSVVYLSSFSFMPLLSLSLSHVVWRNDAIVKMRLLQSRARGGHLSCCQVCGFCELRTLIEWLLRCVFYTEKRECLIVDGFYLFFFYGLRRGFTGYMESCLILFCCACIKDIHYEIGPKSKTVLFRG